MLKFIPRDDALKKPSPWQRRKDLGLIRAVLSTVKQVLTKPYDFFQNLEITDSFLDPLLFYLVVTITASATGFLFWITMIEKQRDWMTYFFMTFVIIPSIAILNIVFMTFLLHFLVKWFNGTGGIRKTFNIVAYTGAANIFQAIPFLGGFLALTITFIWSMVVYTIGLRRLYRFSTQKSIFIISSVILTISILTSIGANAIQNYSREVIKANETVAVTNLIRIALALESYAQQNEGAYPKDIYDFKIYKSEFTKSFSAYNSTNQGYAYIFNLTSLGYGVIAGPIECGFTGDRVFKVTEGGKFYRGNCTARD